MSGFPESCQIYWKLNQRFLGALGTLLPKELPQPLYTKGTESSRASCPASSLDTLRSLEGHHRCLGRNQPPGGVSLFFWALTSVSNPVSKAPLGGWNGWSDHVPFTLSTMGSRQPVTHAVLSAKHLFCINTHRSINMKGIHGFSWIPLVTFSSNYWFSQVLTAPNPQIPWFCLEKYIALEPRPVLWYLFQNLENMKMWKWI